MAYARKDISNDRVKRYYKRYQSIKEVAKRLECSERLVIDALRGVRTDPNLSIRQRKKRGEKICEACNTRPVEPGFRKLCLICHRAAGSDINHDMVYGERYVYHTFHT